MTKDKNFLLNIGISNLSKHEVLENIKKWLKKKGGFYQIVTINPEILIFAQKNKRFREVINKSQVATADGIGILLAAKILGQPLKEKVTGVELMREMVKVASDLGLMVGMIGGRDDVALKTAECLKKTCPNFKFFALDGVKNIKKATADEWAKIISIIHANKPQMLFVAFGAPHQEFFIESLKNDRRQTTDDRRPLIAMGVGGSFDEISGRVKRVPKRIEKLGFKWLWRLVKEPWRWRRQLALPEFVWLVLREKYRKHTRDHPMTF